LEDLITSKVVKFTLTSPFVPDDGLISIYIRSTSNFRLHKNESLSAIWESISCLPILTHSR